MFIISIQTKNKSRKNSAPEHSQEHYLSQQAEIAAKRFTAINYLDLPQGNFRYLMCSKKVDDEVLKRVNHAIKILGMEETSATKP